MNKSEQSPSNQHYLASGTLSLASKIDVAAARDACLNLESHLPAPSLLEHITPSSNHFPRCSLFYTPEVPGIIEFPERLFQETHDLEPCDLPVEWSCAYDHTAEKLRRGRRFERFHAQCAAAIRNETFHDDLVPREPLLAAALLYLLSPKPGTALRKALMDEALNTALSAYIVAGGLLVPEEHAAVINGLSSSSQCLYWASRISVHRHACATVAKERFDFWAGLTLGLSDIPEIDLAKWLQGVCARACESPEAAGAVIILQPQLASTARESLLATILKKGDPRCAIEVARFAKWTSGDWLSIAEQLRPRALDEPAGSWFYNWFALVEPERAQDILDITNTADPLWCAELLGRFNLNETPFRFRMAELQATRVWDKESTAVFRWLNERRERKRHEPQE